MTTIAPWSFQNCQMMKTVHLPSSLQTISNNAFSYSSIENVVIPESVYSIDQAFANCVKLKNVTILSKSMGSLGPYTFTNTAIEGIIITINIITIIIIIIIIIIL